ncbi:amidase signature domain-containing protein [Dichotomopilus funicola]|uniref:Amidase signature domain-containing protein n=1 Tax=Dichotomopilus funicola TaxID=1934379 RepID=A0AAN6ZMS5_9PEZI|nr:amidase signature domain-containing protein [Dichotomopilus funicola]
MPFDVLTATASDLRVLLEQRKVTSVQLVQAYLQQIRTHNKDGARLRAVISVVPEKQLLDTAAQLDQERESGKTRSPYHGIPYSRANDDNMWTATSFTLPTTCGAYALKDAIARENADVVQALLDAGLILLGKANLSEMAGFKGDGGYAGWSTIGGAVLNDLFFCQTQSPYVPDGIDPTDSWLGHSTPAGSSSESAVAVAAGMAPIALCTETDGSITQPSDRASLHSLKLSVGKASFRGILPGTPLADSAGPMTKSPDDVAALLDILTPLKEGSHYDFLTKSFAGLRIGILDEKECVSSPNAVRPNDAYNEQFNHDFNKAIDLVEKAGAHVKRDIPLRKFTIDTHNLFPEFINGLDHSHVKTMQDLVDFNKKYADICLQPGTPNQVALERAATAEMSKETYEKYTAALRRHNREEGIDAMLQGNGVDVLIGPPRGRFNTIATAANYPIGTIPLGYATRFNGRAFGLAVVAPENKESLILKVMSAWEAAMPKRQPPPKLAKWDGAAFEK